MLVRSSHYHVSYPPVTKLSLQICCKRNQHGRRWGQGLVEATSNLAFFGSGMGADKQSHVAFSLRDVRLGVVRACRHV